MERLKRLGMAMMLGACLGLPGAGSGQAADAPLRIGLLTDMTGPAADPAGPGSVIAVGMAVADFTAGFPAGKAPFAVEIVKGDHLGKPDVGAAIVRRWLDVEDVSAVVGVSHAAVGFAVSDLVRERDKVFLATAVSSSELDGKRCSPNTIHWAFDTWALAHSTAEALVRSGAKSWYFLTADFAFGLSMEHDAGQVVRANGGQVLGAARHPYGTTEFSSFLLQAQSSGAKVIALANSGSEAISAIKTAKEFGLIEGGHSLAALLFMLPDVKGLGLETAQGMLLSESFYWDLNDRTRAWSQRFAALNGGTMPSMIQAADYALTLAYLRQLAATGRAAGGRKLVAAMKAQGIAESLFGPVTIRADGRALHPMYLFQVKKPSESRGPWDFYKLVNTIPADQAFRPVSEGGCPLVVNG